MGTLGMTSPNRLSTDNASFLLGSLPPNGKVAPSSSHYDVLASSRDPDVNPYINATPTSSALRVINMGLLLAVAPFRLLMIVLVILSCFFFAMIGTAGHTQNAPLATWRKIVLFPLRFFIRAGVFFGGVWWVTERGRRAGKEEAKLIIPNHITFLDPLYFSARTGGCAVSDSKNAPGYIMRTIFMALQTIMLDRIGFTATERKLTRDKIAARAADPRYPQVLIFPEGTTGNGRAVCHFKTGAFTPMLPVQPVAIRYPHRFFDPSWGAGSACPGALVLLCRMLTSWYIPMEVNWLPVHVPTEAEKADTSGNLFARNVRNEIATALGIRTCEYGHGDVQLANIANRHGLPAEIGIVELEGLRMTSIEVDLSMAKLLLREFIAVKPERDTGLIRYRQFAELLLRIGERAEREGADSGGNGSGFTAAASSSAGGHSVASPAPLHADVDASKSHQVVQLLPDAGSSSTATGGQSAVPDARTFLTALRNSDGGVAALPAYAGEIKRLFDCLDSDCDGALQYRDVLIGLTVLSGREKQQQQQQQHHHAVDSDNGSSSPKRYPQLLRFAFKMMDENGSSRPRPASSIPSSAVVVQSTSGDSSSRLLAGRVTPERVGRVLRSVWPDLAHERALELFSKADSKGDGYLDEEEFVSAFSTAEGAAALQTYLPLFLHRYVGFAGDWLGRASTIENEAATARRRRAASSAAAPKQQSPTQVPRKSSKTAAEHVAIVVPAVQEWPPQKAQVQPAS